MSNMAHTFLESVTGYSQDVIKAALGSAGKAIKIAVIDPAYVAYTYPTTLPKVTFEGEDTVSEKRYPVAARGYYPGPSDRVIMVPVGNTYAIIGVISPAAVPPIFAEDSEPATVTTSSTTYVTLTGGPSVSIDLRAGQYARVVIETHAFVETIGVNGAMMSFRVTGASGTFEPNDEDGTETGSGEWDAGSRTKIWGPASSGGSHTFEARYKRVGTTATVCDYKLRRIVVEALNG